MYPAIETERNARRTNSTRMMRSFKGSPHHVQAPVDAQDLPGDVGGLRGSEKPDGGCDLLRVPPPLERAPPLHRPDHLRPRLPPGEHPLEGDARSVHHAHQVDPHDPFPIRRGRREERDDPVPPRVVHPDVQPSELFPDLGSRAPSCHEPPPPDPSPSTASGGNSLTLTFPDGYTTVVPMRRTRHLLAILMAAAFLIPSCSGKLSKQTGLTDTAMFSRGQQKLAKKSYSSAIEHFQVLLERFPTSPLAPKTQLALADARMENGDNVEAEVAFDDFLRLYPASDNVPYALFRKGELLFRQGSKPGRDPTTTLQASRTYKLLLEKNPSGPYAETAARRLGDLRNRLAENEVMVGFPPPSPPTDTPP